MEKTSITNRAGFTLVEMMMAMLVLTVGLLGLLQSIQVAYQHNSRNRVREEAVLLAEEQMNDLRSNASLYPSFSVITASRLIGGVEKKFTVVKESQQIGSDTGTNRLAVSVRWAFKNITTRHDIYTFKRM